MPGFKWRLPPYLAYACTLFIFFGVLLHALASGAGDIRLTEVFAGTLDASSQIIWWDIRLPRVIVAALCGAALAVAGVVSQGIFRNPLASPSVIGTTGGANLGVVLLIYLGIGQEHWAVQPLVAFIGAVGTTLVVLKLAQYSPFQGNERLLLLGFSLNSIYAAVSGFILSLSLPQYGVSQAISYWLLGGLSGKGWYHVLMMLPGLVIGFVLAFSLHRQLDVFSLGEDIASSLSISIPRLRRLSIAALSLLVAAAVAVCGGISFVGLIVPHFTRLYSGQVHAKLLPLSLLNGMTLLVFADTLARTMWAPRELQVGSIIALIGAPTFIFLLFRQQSYRSGH